MAISRSLLIGAFLVALPFLWQATKQTFDGFDADAMVAGQKVLVTGASSGIGEQMAYKCVVVVPRESSKECGMNWCVSELIYLENLCRRQVRRLRRPCGHYGTAQI